MNPRSPVDGVDMGDYEPSEAEPGSGSGSLAGRILSLDSLAALYARSFSAFRLQVSRDHLLPTSAVNFTFLVMGTISLLSLLKPKPR